MGCAQWRKGAVPHDDADISWSSFRPLPHVSRMRCQAILSTHEGLSPLTLPSHPMPANAGDAYPDGRASKRGDWRSASNSRWCWRSGRSAGPNGDGAANVGEPWPGKCDQQPGDDAESDDAEHDATGTSHAVCLVVVYSALVSKLFHDPHGTGRRCKTQRSCVKRCSPPKSSRWSNHWSHYPHPCPHPHPAGHHR